MEGHGRFSLSSRPFAAIVTNETPVARIKRLPRENGDAIGVMGSG